MGKPPSRDERVLRAEAQKWKSQIANEQPSAEAWRKLLFGLKAGKEQFSNGNLTPDLPDGFESAVHFLLEVRDFLGSHSIIKREQLDTPLKHLLEQLFDVAHGRSAPLFSPTALGRGARQEPVGFINVEAIAARALQEMSLAGVKLQPASEEIAKAVRATRLPEFADCTADKVKNWRDRLKKYDRGKEKIPHSMAARWKEPLPDDLGNDHARRAEFLLSLLRDKSGRPW